MQRVGPTGLKYPKHTVAHRNDIANHLHQQWAGKPPYLDGVTLVALFTFPRPASHYGTGRNREQVKPSAPASHTQTPDLDKLLRLVGDALTIAGVLRDDSQIHTIIAKKQWGSIGETSIRIHGD